MVEFNIDRLNVVLDPDIILCQETSDTSEKDSNTGEQTAEAVPSGEVFPAGDLLVEIDGAKSTSRGQHGKQVENPGDDHTVHYRHLETSTSYSPVKLDLVRPLRVVKKWRFRRKDCNGLRHQETEGRSHEGRVPGEEVWPGHGSVDDEGGDGSCDEVEHHGDPL